MSSPMQTHSKREIQSSIQGEAVVSWFSLGNTMPFLSSTYETQTIKVRSWVNPAPSFSYLARVTDISMYSVTAIYGTLIRALHVPHVIHSDKSLRAVGACCSIENEEYY
jgi:hypothetical protein